MKEKEEEEEEEEEEESGTMPKPPPVASTERGRTGSNVGRRHVPIAIETDARRASRFSPPAATSPLSTWSARIPTPAARREDTHTDTTKATISVAVPSLVTAEECVMCQSPPVRTVVVGRASTRAPARMGSGWAWRWKRRVRDLPRLLTRARVVDQRAPTQLARGTDEAPPPPLPPLRATVRRRATRRAPRCSLVGRTNNTLLGGGMSS